MADDGFAVVDGALVPLAEAVLPVTDVQVTHGLGVYETLSSDADPGPNLARLRESVAAIGVPMPDEDVLREEIARVAAAVGAVAWIRVNVTGDGRRIVFGTPAVAERRHQAVRCGRAPHVDHPLLAGAVKHRSRGPWVAELRRREVDELLFVDAAGRFTEGTSCAVLAVVDGVVFTAPWDGPDPAVDDAGADPRARRPRPGSEVRRLGPLAEVGRRPWDRCTSRARRGT
ncbi:MAG: aminotransferase class IV [Myxococcota bacterium]